MASRGLEWKVGVTVLSATVLFVAGVIYLGQMEVGRPGPRVHVRFPEVGGLNVGDPVMVSGLRRGAVAAVDLDDEGVLVTLKLRPDVVLRSDAAFSVENMGIMGEKFIAVVPGRSPDSLDTGRVIPGGYSPGITEAMAGLGVVLDDIGSIVARVEGILQEQEIVEPLQETVAMLRDVSAELRGILEENRVGVRTSIESFRSLSQNLDAVVRTNREEVDSAVAHVSSASARFDHTMEDLDSTIQSLERIVSRVEEGEGTLGHLTKDEQLYRELLEATGNLNDLLKDIRKNPKRYLKIEIF